MSCGTALERNSYRIRVLNTIDFKKSMHYNPFEYIHSEKDILKLVTALIANTKGEGKAGEEQNFNTLLEMLNSMEVREDDEDFENAVDLMFKELADKDPEHFAVRQYKKFKMAAGQLNKCIFVVLRSQFATSNFLVGYKFEQCQQKTKSCNKNIDK